MQVQAALERNSTCIEVTTDSLPVCVTSLPDRHFMLRRASEFVHFRSCCLVQFYESLARLLLPHVRKKNCLLPHTCNSTTSIVNNMAYPPRFTYSPLTSVAEKSEHIQSTSYSKRILATSLKIFYGLAIIFPYIYLIWLKKQNFIGRCGLSSDILFGNSEHEVQYFKDRSFTSFSSVGHHCHRERRCISHHRSVLRKWQLGS